MKYFSLSGMSQCYIKRSLFPRVFGVKSSTFRNKHAFKLAWLFAILSFLIFSSGHAFERNMGFIGPKPEVVGSKLTCSSTGKIQFNAKGVREIEVVGESIGGDLSVGWFGQKGAEVLAKPVVLGSEKRQFVVTLKPEGDGNYVITLNPVNCTGDISFALSLGQRSSTSTKEIGIPWYALVLAIFIFLPAVYFVLRRRRNKIES